MKVLAKATTYSTTIKKSKFLCFGYMVQTKDDVKNIINKLKKEYPDASHICYAYILDDKTFYFTDGGEPSGSAGKPIYSALLSFKLNYTLFVIVRYFGGIKFGPGPLKQTFKNLTIDALNRSQIKNSELVDLIQIEVPLSQSSKINKLFKSIIVITNYDGEHAIYTIKGKAQKLIPFFVKLKVKILLIKNNQIV